MRGATMIPYEPLRETDRSLELRVTLGPLVLYCGYSWDAAKEIAAKYDGAACRWRGPKLLSGPPEALAKASEPASESAQRAKQAAWLHRVSTRYTRRGERE